MSNIDAESVDSIEAGRVATLEQIDQTIINSRYQELAKEIEQYGKEILPSNADNKTIAQVSAFALKNYYINAILFGDRNDPAIAEKLAQWRSMAGSMFSPVDVTDDNGKTIMRLPGLLPSVIQPSSTGETLLDSGLPISHTISSINNKNNVMPSYGDKLLGKDIATGLNNLNIDSNAITDHQLGWLLAKYIFIDELDINSFLTKSKESKVPTASGTNAISLADGLSYDD